MFTHKFMLMHKFVFAIGLATAGSNAAFALEDSPNLGQAATQADIAAWDISIAPDGTGLPPGNGTAKQGEALFKEKCVTCHGEKGVGTKTAVPLAGGFGTLTGDAPLKTVGSYWPYATTLFDFVRRGMPLTQPESLTNEEVYALSAYILNLNGVIGAKDVMNAKTLPKVKMPNREKFFSVYPNSRP